MALRNLIPINEAVDCDPDALAIGEVYRKAKRASAGAFRLYIQCGEMLIAKKKSEPHGEWVSWVGRHQETLGFDIRAAQRYMDLARNTSSTTHLETASEEDFLQLSRQVWGNEEDDEAKHHRTQGTGEEQWFTPAKYIDAARVVLGEIDLDPASCIKAQESVRAARFYSVEDDGLKQEWNGRVWLNPPYTQPAIQHFVDKLVSEVDAKHVTAAVLLTHNYTDTAWFHNAEARADRICFTRGRIQFVDPEGNAAQPTQGQAFFYFGKDAALFTKTFRSIGFIR